jgi:hypothetical protein
MAGFNNEKTPQAQPLKKMPSQTLMQQDNHKKMEMA